MMFLIPDVDLLEGENRAKVFFDTSHHVHMLQSNLIAENAIRCERKDGTQTSQTQLRILPVNHDSTYCFSPSDQVKHFAPSMQFVSHRQALSVFGTIRDNSQHHSSSS